MSATVLSLLVSLVTVSGWSAARIYDVVAPSSTTVSFLGASKDQIYLLARNTGPKPSVVRKFILNPNPLPLRDLELELYRPGDAGTASSVPGHDTTALTLITQSLERTKSETELRQKLAELQDETITLQVLISESDGNENVPLKIKVGDIAEFLKTQAGPAPGAPK